MERHLIASASRLVAPAAPLAVAAMKTTTMTRGG